MLARGRVRAVVVLLAMPCLGVGPCESVRPPLDGDAGVTDGSVTCAEGRAPCGATCVDLSSDTANCGACGRACATAPHTDVSCDFGMCVSACVAGWADCDGRDATGCEQRIDDDTANCGACGHACTDAPANALPACLAGVCRFACRAGYGDCDADPTNGCELPLVDPANCGACGRACQAGTCEAGLCPPVALARHVNFPIDVAVGGGYVYWTETGTATTPGNVVRVPQGGGVPETVVSHDYGPYAIAADATMVYWGAFATEGGISAVWSLPHVGGTPVVLAAGQASVVDLALDATRACWSDSYAGNLMSVSLAGGDPVALAVGQGEIDRIAIDGTNAYWHAAVGEERTVMKVPLAGGEPVVLATRQLVDHPRGIATDGASVYWTEHWYDGALVKVPVQGGEVVTVAAAQSYPGPLLLDAIHAYWFNEGPDYHMTLFRVPLAGGAPQAVAATIGYLGGVASDATHVYWVATMYDADGSGSVWRVEK